MSTCKSCAERYTCHSCNGQATYDPARYPGGTFCENKGCPAYQEIPRRKTLDHSKYKDRASPPDRQAFDEIRIRTIPRFKTSGMSGDEWRISANVQFIRKGQVIEEDAFRDVETAASVLAWSLIKARENGCRRLPEAEKYCDQEGCSEIATVAYRVKKDFCNKPHEHEALQPRHTGIYRLFCNAHACRGDSLFNDCDENYELVERVN